MEQTADIVLTVSKISHTYASKSILEEISLCLARGEILCVVGRSGCGKSTLLNVISGEQQPSSGSVSLQSSYAIVPQTDLLLPWRTVLENAALPLEIQGIQTKAGLQSVYEQLHALGLEGYKNYFPHQLSGGMRQKVSIARAFAQDADLLLFDEPFSALDFNARLRAGKELRNLIKTRNKSVIFVTHNIEEAISLGDRILVFGGTPTRISYEVNITIDENLRDPVSVRKTPQFSEIFERIWKILCEEVWT